MENEKEADALAYTKHVEFGLATQFVNIWDNISGQSIPKLKNLHLEEYDKPTKIH